MNTAKAIPKLSSTRLFGHSVVGTLGLALDLLGGNFARIFVDNVADAFQVDPVIALNTSRTPGAGSVGANVSSRMWSASSIRPRPMATRPKSLLRAGAAAERNHADDE
jgi:hypothetical protein